MNNWKETSLGLLPSDWDINPLGNFLYIKGRIGWKGLKKSEYVDEGYAIINGEQIVDGKVDWLNVGRVPKERFDESPEIILKQGDILMTKDGTIGKLAYVETLPEPATVASGVFVIREKSTLLHQPFLYYYFRSHYFEHLIKSRTEGSVIPHLYQRDLTEMEIPLPKRDEQIRIAKTLSILDRKIDNLRKQNQALETLAQTLFIHWFIDFEFPTADGKPYKSSDGKMIDSEMGQIPKGWKAGSFGNIAETVGGGTPSTNEESYWQDGDIQWYSPTDLTKSNQLFSLNSGNKISRLGLQKSSAKLFPPHSIMLTSRATIGEISINSSEASTNQGFITIIPNSRFTLPFLLGCVKYNLPIIKSLASGSTFPEISKTNFRNIGLFIPTDEIINTFTKASMPLLMKIESNIKTIQKLKNFNAILLPKLMSGQLRIKE